MGISYSAAIIVGLPKDDLFEHESYQDFLDGELDQTPPYYDGGSDAIMGIIVQESPQYGVRELEDNLDFLIEKAKKEFKEKTGLNGIAFLTPVGY